LERRTSQFATLLERAPVGVYLVDEDFRIVEVNPKAMPVFASIPDVIGRDFREVMHVLWPKTMADEIVAIFQHTLDTGQSHYEAEQKGRRVDTGITEYYEWRTCRIELSDDRQGVVFYFHDVSSEIAARLTIARSEERLRELNLDLEGRVLDEVNRRAKAEEALRHGQKMEAVGQLTGGIAHDFNNLLTVIIGGLEIAQRGPPDDARRNAGLDLALKGAMRAADLTSRLLAFSRRQPLEPKRLDVNVLVQDMYSLLHRTLGEQVQLESRLAPQLWPAEADKGQLESAIINLAVNARDAMPDGGRLTIETSNTFIDEASADREADVAAGPYICISVTDSGCGMSAEVQSRAIEPFFTTKEVGRGTGLGLSMIYGFVKQSGGYLSLSSELGVGTTVRLYFPRCVGNASHAGDDRGTPSPKVARGEVVLVVEDNEDVRIYTVMTLTELGYHVREAADYEQAMTVLHDADHIDLLLTDVVLPGKSGREIADEATRIRPALKILFATGYSRDAIVHHGRLDPGVSLITKPFTFEQLALKVREVLDKR
jgi:PAS domain S-box-containing protein